MVTGNGAMDGTCGRCRRSEVPYQAQAHQCHHPFAVVRNDHGDLRRSNRDQKRFGLARPPTQLTKRRTSATPTPASCCVSTPTPRPTPTVKLQTWSVTASGPNSRHQPGARQPQEDHRNTDFPCRPMRMRPEAVLELDGNRNHRRGEPARHLRRRCGPTQHLWPSHSTTAPAPSAERCWAVEYRNPLRDGRGMECRPIGCPQGVAPSDLGIL